MTVTPVNATAGTTTPPDAMKQLSSNFSTFLTLLTTQLKNQDPTSPMDSNAFTQQLVMYSQVEQQIDTNSNLKSLISQSSSNAAAMTTGYLGKKVSIVNGQAALIGGNANWTYNLTGPAAATQLDISDSNGKTVYSTSGATGSGNHSFTWDGKDSHGNPLSDGSYKLTVTATDSAGGPVASSVASAGTVTQIDMTGGTPRLIIGSMEIDLANIAAVAN
ncbi:MAG TPA: FlgD immunoglobulin-like domain containing protein [Rhizomicrobium sp.]|nr:FlgD immunoglobulin-like domain containing protein [Rhizomicrobium sp.]